MANETTSTSLSTLLSSEHLGAILPANLPKMVVLNHVNRASIAGLPTKTYKLPLYSDLGAASAATEGTALANTEITMGSAVSITCTELAGVSSTLTDVAIERAFPGLSGVPEIMQSGNGAAMLGLLAPHVMRHVSMLVEKAESDTIKLLDNFSTTSSGTGVDDDLTFDVLMTAIYNLKTLEPNGSVEDWRFLLAPQQTEEARKDIAITSGGYGASVFTSQADLNFFNFRPDVSRNGFAGTVLGVPVFEYSHSIRNLDANSGNSVSGALVVGGVGEPGIGGGNTGAICFVEGRSPSFTHYAELDGQGRGIKLTSTYVYGVAEIKDTHGVSIITDA